MGGLLVLFTFSLLLGGCGGDEPTDDGENDYNRGALLQQQAAWIQDKTGAVLTETKELNQALATLKAESNEANLRTLQMAFDEAYQSWQAIDFLDMGPASDNYLISAANTFPCKPELIDENIDEGNTNLEPANQLSAQGFPALDYLLHQESIEATLPYFEEDNYMAYFELLTTRLDDKVASTVTGWSTFESEFIADEGSDAGSSIAVVFNAFVENFERRTRDGKFGIPAGVRTDNEIQTDQIESLYQPELSLALAKANVIAFKDFFNGGDQDGFDDYLDFLESKRDGVLLSKVINDQFDVVLDRIDAFDTDLATTLETDKTKLLDVFNEMQKLIVYLKVDMASELGILINYADNDGDS